MKSIYTFLFVPRLNWNRRLNFGFGSFSLYYTASCSGTPASRGFTFIGYYRFTFFKLKNFCENEVLCQWYFVYFLQIHQIAAVAFLRFPHLLWKKVLHHHPQHTKWVSVSGFISEFFVKSLNYFLNLSLGSGPSWTSALGGLRTEYYDALLKKFQ